MENHRFFNQQICACTIYAAHIKKFAGYGKAKV